jgi:hypothetical protein
MKTIVWILILAGLAVGGYYGYKAWEKNSAVDEAKSRVEGMLSANASGDEQTALCMWAQGAAVLSLDEIKGYTRHFDNFVRAAALDPPPQNWTVEEVILEEYGYARVTVDLDGRKLRLKVGRREPIELLQ